MAPKRLLQLPCCIPIHRQSISSPRLQAKRATHNPSPHYIPSTPSTPHTPSLSQPTASQDIKNLGTQHSPAPFPLPTPPRPPGPAYSTPHIPQMAQTHDHRRPDESVAVLAVYVCPCIIDSGRVPAFAVVNTSKSSGAARRSRAHPLPPHLQPLHRIDLVSCLGLAVFDIRSLCSSEGRLATLPSTSSYLWTDTMLHVCYNKLTPTVHSLCPLLILGRRHRVLHNRTPDPPQLPPGAPQLPLSSLQFSLILLQPSLHKLPIRDPPRLHFPAMLLPLPIALR